MELFASLMSEDRFNELLAVVSVKSDTAQAWRDGFKRKIHGIADSQGPLWERFVQFWQQPQWKRFEEDGVSYFPVNCLQVDFDLYGMDSWMSVKGAECRLILFEGFQGTPDEYYEEVKLRNQRFAEYSAAWHKDGLTRNDYRELRGMPRKDKPFFNEPIPKEALEAAWKQFLHPKRRGDFRNYIV
jgi:hypothetical protein